MNLYDFFVDRVAAQIESVAFSSLLRQKDPFPSAPKSRGELLNRRAWLGSQIVTLKEQIPECAKQARKTPPKSNKTELEKVELAKKMLPELKRKLVEFQEEHTGLRTRLEQMGAYGFKALVAASPPPQSWYDEEVDPFSL